jgi:outer membrane protein assembly factor BamA
MNFDGPIHLPPADVAQIITEANQNKLNADDSNWIEEFADIGLRGAWMNHGFYNVKVSAEARSLGGNSSNERFLVTVHLNEGLQYRLGDIRFVGDTRISEAELRPVVPIRSGELFDVSLVRAAIQALSKLYSSRGYIDFTAVPDAEIDDNLQRISLAFQLDPQKQFRVGKVEIVALDPRLEARLRGLVRPGEIYNSEAVADFFKENKSVLPSGLSLTDDIHVLRNVKAGIVDLTFDFRTCP